MTAPLLLAALALIYNPADWLHYPAMNRVRGIAAATNRLYVAVPAGVYIFSRHGNEHLTTVTAADGLTGAVRYCAYNPARNELLIITETALYAYHEDPPRLRPLDPPFTRVHSVGISPGAAWLETDKGLYRRGRPGEDLVPESNLPLEADWYGARDTLTARDFPQLTPYFITDDQLITHDLGAARLDPRSRRLYVAARDYGLLVYNLTSGLPERHLRYGPPPGRVRRLTSFPQDGSLWFLADDHSLIITADNQWRYARTRVADIILPPDLRRLAGVRELIARAGLRLNAVIGDSHRFLAATDEGLYIYDTTGTELRLGTGDLRPLALALAGPDTLLIGTDAGLLTLTGDSLRPTPDPFDRSGFGIYAIAVADDGTRWYGAFGGILRHTPDGEWEHIIPPGFDLGRPVRALAAADSILFIPHDRGITAWNLRTNAWEEIGLREGLPASEVTALYADDRHLWIAGPGMVSRFDHARGLPR